MTFSTTPTPAPPPIAEASLTYAYASRPPSVPMTCGRRCAHADAFFTGLHQQRQADRIDFTRIGELKVKRVEHMGYFRASTGVASCDRISLWLSQHGLNTPEALFPGASGHCFGWQSISRWRACSTLPACFTFLRTSHARLRSLRRYLCRNRSLCSAAGHRQQKSMAPALVAPTGCSASERPWCAGWTASSSNFLGQPQAGGGVPTAGPDHLRAKMTLVPGPATRRAVGNITRSTFTTTSGSGFQYDGEQTSPALGTAVAWQRVRFLAKRFASAFQLIAAEDSYWEFLRGGIVPSLTRH